MTIAISWDAVDRAQWEHWFATVPRSNLLQSWGYGEARERIEGFRVRRGLITRAGETLGLVQALERRERTLGNLGTVVRINRGPLWLREPGLGVLQETLEVLRALAGWWRGRALVIVPELEESEAHMALLRRSLTRRLSPPPWRSAWIDLTEPEPQLWSALDGKWRNMVSAARRREVEVTFDESDGAFDWLMERYSEFRESRGFAGPSLELLRALRQAAGAEATPVLRARAASRWVAGVLIVRHGSSATYLVGWSGDEGRKVRANNALLWAALGELSRRGCQWLDLGGIDDAATPGVAEFKRGMGGREYVLSGTHLAL